MLLDDELPGLSYLKLLCEQLPELEVVKAFNSPTVFLAEVPFLDFDLVILDIEMPEMNGLQVAQLLKGKPVIFTTAYKEFAADAFDLAAVDYVRKPVDKQRLEIAIRKAVQQHNGEKKSKSHIQLNTDKGKAIIYFTQLLYVKTSEIDSRDKVAFLDDGTSLTLKNISFEKLQSFIPKLNFCRVNKKELIALKIVQAFTFDEITITVKNNLNKQMKVALSEAYRLDFLKKVTI